MPPEAMGPKELPYTEGQPVPQGYHVAEEGNTALVAVGAPLFGGLYLITLMAGTVGYDEADQDQENAYPGQTFDADENPDNWIPLFFPIAGPFIAMGTLEPRAPAYIPLILDGLGQTAGLVMFIVGLAVKDKVLVRNDVAKPKIEVAPLVGANGSGVALTGTF